MLLVYIVREYTRTSYYFLLINNTATQFALSDCIYLFTVFNRIISFLFREN